MSSGPTALEISRDGAVATLTLQRPERLNALTGALRLELAEALERLGADEAVRAVVLTGAGRAFCAGQDLEDFDAEGDIEGLVRSEYNRIITALVELPKPVVAAVNGVAAGAGMGLALACDVRIMAAEAVLVGAFLQIGLVPDSGVSSTLVRGLGYARAFELLASGRKLGAEEALAAGLVTEVVPAAEIAAAAAARAAALAAGPTAALAATKQLLRRAEHAPLAELLALEAAAQGAAVRSADHREGTAAFRERRAPHFEGR